MRSLHDERRTCASGPRFATTTTSQCWSAASSCDFGIPASAGLDFLLVTLFMAETSVSALVSPMHNNCPTSRLLRQFRCTTAGVSRWSGAHSSGEMGAPSYVTDVYEVAEVKVLVDMVSSIPFTLPTSTKSVMFCSARKWSTRTGSVSRSFSLISTRYGVQADNLQGT